MEPNTAGRAFEASQGQFCQKCGAWKGELGLEPDPQLFVEHLVEIFREVKRVLRKDGTLWLNLGDSYVSNASGKANNGFDNHFRTEHRATLNKKHQGAMTKRINGLKPKDLVGIPWRTAFALQADGWYLRSAIPWVKRSAMPESCNDRPASALEHVFLLAKSQKYYFDMDAIRKKQTGTAHSKGKKLSPPIESAGIGHKDWHKCTSQNDLGDRGRNFRNTDLFFESLEPPFGAIFADDELVGLDINPKGFADAHFATYPERLPEVAILAGCPKGGTVLDPFGGAMTTAIVAHKHGRKFIIIELSEKYIADIGVPRIEKETRQLKLF